MACHPVVRPLIAALAMCGSVLPSASAGQRPIEPRAVLEVALPESTLPPSTARTMQAEAERIWLRQGIRIAWQTADTRLPLPTLGAVRVLLLQSEAIARPGQIDYVLGDAQPLEGKVRVSLGGAARVVAEGQKSLESLGVVNSEQVALGYVLGRALAHEIGHYLLGPGHSSSGLMRAAFRPADMVDPRRGMFDLNREDIARLREKIGDGSLASLLTPIAAARAAN